MRCPFKQIRRIARERAGVSTELAILLPFMITFVIGTIELNLIMFEASHKSYMLERGVRSLAVEIASYCRNTPNQIVCDGATSASTILTNCGHPSPPNLSNSEMTVVTYVSKSSAIDSTPFPILVGRATYSIGGFTNIINASPTQTTEIQVPIEVVVAGCGGNT